MPVRFRSLVVFLALAVLALACQKPASPNKPASGAPETAGAAASADPIKDAVITYLTKVRGLDLSKMNIAITNQKVAGDKATCDGAFTVKGVEGMPPMEYSYELAKEGGAWKVTSSKGKDGGHAGGPPASGGDMPPGHPGMGGAETQGQAGGLGMPAGHPDVSDMSQPKPADAQPKGK